MLSTTDLLGLIVVIVIVFPKNVRCLVAGIFLHSVTSSHWLRNRLFKTATLTTLTPRTFSDESSFQICGRIFKPTIRLRKSSVGISCLKARRRRIKSNKRKISRCQNIEPASCHWEWMSHFYSPTVLWGRRWKSTRA
jgi:hypothetical protein